MVRGPLDRDGLEGQHLHDGDVRGKTDPEVRYEGDEDGCAGARGGLAKEVGGFWLPAQLPGRLQPVWSYQQAAQSGADSLASPVGSGSFLEGERKLPRR